MLTPSLLACGLLLLAAPPPAAKAEELNPGDIVKKAMSRNLFGLSGTANATMLVHSSKGDEKTRDLAVRLMRTPAGLQRAQISFRSPPEVAGTSFLVLERADGLPDQYLYLPALKKVRRIAAGQATDSFMGSDLTYLDLSPLPQGSEKDVEFKRMADAEVGGQPVYVIEALAKIPGSPYSRIVTSIHKEHLIPLEILFYDQTGKELKVARIKKLKKIDGKLLPVELEVKSSQKGSFTVLTLTEVDLKAKLTEAEFTPEAMQQ